MTPVELTPVQLAELLRPMLDTALIGFDVDGVLAPIVEHADDARLTDGVGASLATLSAHATIAIVSGRSLDDLERRFGFPEDVHVIGSHGLEIRGDDELALEPNEAHTLRQLALLGQKTVDAAGSGAWLETKPASVVVHTRSADPALADEAVAVVSRLAAMVPGAQVKPGHQVVELLARDASKGDALLALARRTGCSPLVFIGDDVTDEDAFVSMGDEDISVRVGGGETIARYRVCGPDDVAAALTRLI